MSRHTETAWSSASKPWRCVCVCVCVCVQAHRNSLEQRIKVVEVGVCVSMSRHAETAWSSASKPLMCVCVCVVW